MKNAWISFFVFCLLCHYKVSAQVYALDNGFTNGGQVRTCAGNFKDSNPFGDYANNERYTVTFNTAASVGQAMQFDFDSLSIGTSDTLFIYDGTSTTAPLITTLSTIDRAPLSIRATALNSSGSLTILFKSGSTGVASGWNAAISCKSPCQSIGVNITTVPAPDASGFVNICKGGTVTFTGTGNYLQNDIYYHQTDTTAKYLWSFSDGKDTTGIFAKQIKRNFNNEGGTIVQLALMDQNECYNLAATRVKIRTSITPTFSITPKQICLFDTTTLMAKPIYAEAIFSNLPVYSDNKPLNDGVGKCYETSINVTKFLPTQKLTNLGDLEGILINMEHSWLGDITIAITAPNGAKVFLKKSVGTTTGWESFLGEPVDEPSLVSTLNTVPGKGYDYLFSPNPEFGTMVDERGKSSYSYTDNAGQSQVNHTYLPEGKYASEEPLTGLLGTTLNGLWTIEVCDNYKEDNGFIFYWTIKFKPNVYPDSEVYTNTITSQKWLPSAGLLSAKDSVATVSPGAAGSFTYKYEVTDNFGCAVDTSVNVTINPLPAKPDLGPDLLICSGKTISLSIKNPQQGDTYKWSNGTSGTNNIQIDRAGRYSVESRNSLGCRVSDTIDVRDNEPISISLGKDTLFCASNPPVLTPEFTGNITRFEWNTGELSRSISPKQAATYWVTGKTNSGCAISDTILVSQNLADLFSLPADTIICSGTSYPLNLLPAPGVALKWEDGSSTNPRIMAGGNYQITASYKGCSKVDELLVGIRPLPVVNLGRDTSICIGFDLPLSVFYPAATYLWSTGSRENKIVANNAGLYWVQATLVNCISRDSLVLTQRRCQCNIKMPNAFSPNGDGINDVYSPEISCFPSAYKLAIFNRYGQQVFSSTNYQDKWTGAVDGSPLPVGTYYYILSFFNVDLQKTEQFKGAITLLR